MATTLLSCKVTSSNLSKWNDKTLRARVHQSLSSLVWVQTYCKVWVQTYCKVISSGQHATQSEPHCTWRLKRRNTLDSHFLRWTVSIHIWWRGLLTTSGLWPSRLHAVSVHVQGNAHGDVFPDEMIQSLVLIARWSTGQPGRPWWRLSRQFLASNLLLAPPTTHSGDTHWTFKHWKNKKKQLTHNFPWRPLKPKRRGDEQSWKSFDILERPENSPNSFNILDQTKCDKCHIYWWTT